MNIDEDRSVPVIDLYKAGAGNFVRKRGLLVEALWMLTEALILNNRMIPISSIRKSVLTLYGARIGVGCRLMHPIRVKAPWNLTVGDRVWLGDGVWIYNQTDIRIGSDVCISQGAFLTTGSHDTSRTMDLRVDPIVIEDGVWVSSFAVVQKGVTIGRSSIVTPLSVVHKSLPSGGIFGGNPCVFISKRFAAKSIAGQRSDLEF